MITYENSLILCNSFLLARMLLISRSTLFSNSMPITDLCVDYSILNYEDEHPKGTCDNEEINQSMQLPRKLVF